MMNKHLTNKETEINYTLSGDYYLPDLSMPAEEQRSIGVWGQRLLRYLRQNRRVFYYNMLTAGKLNAHLSDIDRQAEELFSRLVQDISEMRGITEQLKATDPMRWVRQTNEVRHTAAEIVNAELIYN